MRTPLELRNDAWECLRQADQAPAQRDKAMLLIIAQGWASLAEQMEQMRAPTALAEDDVAVSDEVAELAAALADDGAQSAGAN